MTANSRSNPEQTEQRSDVRIMTSLAAKLIFPAEQLELDCEVKNVSLGGAGVCCDEPPPLDSFIILRIDGLGEFACVATRFANNELGLKFVFNDVKRHRLMRDLLAFTGQARAGETPPPGATAAKRPETI